MAYQGQPGIATVTQSMVLVWGMAICLTDQWQPWRSVLGDLCENSHLCSMLLRDMLHIKEGFYCNHVM